MLRQPVADVAQRVSVAHQIDAVAQRRGGLGARGDDGEVEDRERNHGNKLVRYSRPTKAPLTQIRRASATTRDDCSDMASGTRYSCWSEIIFCPHLGSRTPVTVFAK